MKIFYLTISTDCGITETQTDLYLDPHKAADDALEMIESYDYLEDIKEDTAHLLDWTKGDHEVELTLHLDECGLILGCDELNK